MLIRPAIHWLTTQARNAMLDALGIRHEVTFVRNNRREIEEFCALRADEACDETLETLFPRITNAELASAETERVIVPDGRTERAWPPPSEPAQQTTPHRVMVREDVATKRFHSLVVVHSGEGFDDNAAPIYELRLAPGLTIEAKEVEHA